VFYYIFVFLSGVFSGSIPWQHHQALKYEQSARNKSDRPYARYPGSGAVATAEKMGDRNSMSQKCMIDTNARCCCNLFRGKPKSRPSPGTGNRFFPFR
jgi:hypothetical protein